jgi:hypothetical protein
MSEREAWYGSVGPFLYDDTDTYEDGVSFYSVRGTQGYFSGAPVLDEEVVRLVDLTGDIEDLRAQAQAYAFLWSENKHAEEMGSGIEELGFFDNFMIDPCYALRNHKHDSDYVSIVPTATEDNLAAFTSTGEIQDSGYSPDDFAANSHNHDTEYISIIAPVVTGNFPMQTATGELEDSGYDPADFSAAGHNHDSDYISIIAAPTAGNFPMQTAGGELEDSTYDASDFATAGHDHDTAYISIVPLATEDDIALFDATGEIKDSGTKIADLATSGHNHDSDYISIVSGATEDNLATFDAAGEVKDSGAKVSDFATSGHNHDTAYISIVPLATENNIAVFDAAGEIKDSGSDLTDFATSGHNHDSDYISIVPAAVENNIAVFDAAGEIQDSGSSISTLSPGGLDTHVQFNDSGVLGGEADLTFAKTANVLQVGASTGRIGLGVTPSRANLETSDKISATAALFTGGSGEYGISVITDTDDATLGFNAFLNAGYKSVSGANSYGGLFQFVPSTGTFHIGPLQNKSTWDLGTFLPKFTILYTGEVGIDETSPVEALDVNGRVKLAQTTAPTPTTDRLYNVSGELYWNGTKLGAATIETELSIQAYALATLLPML